MQSGYLEPPVQMGKKDFLIVLPFGEDLPLDSFYQVYGSSFGHARSGSLNPTGRAKTMFVAGISVGDVSWPTSTHLPWRLAPVEGCCLASASFLGVVWQVSSGKSRRARLFGQGSSGRAEREGQR
ncbi:hypothetical protein ACFX1X_043442 [Malus domestica]